MGPVNRGVPFSPPDWRKKENYNDRWGTVDTWELSRWIWEFQKRKQYFLPEDLDVTLFPDEPYPEFGDFDNSSGLVWYFGTGVPWRDGGGVMRIDADDAHVLMRFDIGRPLAPQIEKAQEILMEVQIEKIGKKVSANFHQRNFFAYLRLLDGRHVGASWSQLSSVLPDHIANRTAQAARDFHGQAKALCFKL